MNTQKTVRGVALFARAYSLEDAQRNMSVKKYDNHRPSDEFIRPMWISPEELAKRKKATQH